MAAHPDRPLFQPESSQLKVNGQLENECTCLYWIIAIASIVAAGLEASGSTNIISADFEQRLLLISLLSTAIFIINTGVLNKSSAPTAVEIEEIASATTAVGKLWNTARPSGVRPHSSLLRPKGARFVAQPKFPSYQTGD